MAYVDTHTCAYCHGRAYADAYCDCANTDAGSAYSDTGTDGYGSTDPYSNRDSADGNTGTDANASADGHTHADTHAYAYRRGVRNKMGWFWSILRKW